MTDQPTPAAAFDDLDPDDYALTFTPAPTRKRHAGWTELRQRRFVLLLRETGVVAAAARGAGCSFQSAYRLRAHAGAEGFAAAWDRAIDEGRQRAFDLALDRAVNGYLVPRHYRGRFVGTTHRFDNRMAMAALNCADRLAPGKASVAKRER